MTKAEHQHHVQCLRGQGRSGGCVPLRSWKNAFLKLNSRDLVHTFWQHFIKNYFRINYWLHCYVSSFSHLSCFDAFARTFINLWPLKKGVAERKFPLRSFWVGSSPLRSWKNCNFQIQFAQFGAYLLPTFYWKTNLHFQSNIGYFYGYASHLSCFDAFVRTKTFDHWKYGGVWGATPLRSWEKCKFQTQFAKFGAYLLPTFYWKSIILFQWNIGYYTMSILPTFPFFFYDKILASMSIPPTFPVLIPLLELL